MKSDGATERPPRLRDGIWVDFSVPRPTIMPQLALSCHPTSSIDGCAICGSALRAPGGLCLADNHQPVCEACGRQHAPSLVALVSLASAAERIGRMHRHSIFPPLSALLD